MRSAFGHAASAFSRTATQNASILAGRDGSRYCRTVLTLTLSSGLKTLLLCRMPDASPTHTQTKTGPHAGISYTEETGSPSASLRTGRRRNSGMSLSEMVEAVTASREGVDAITAPPSPSGWGAEVATDWVSSPARDA